MLVWDLWTTNSSLQAYWASSSSVKIPKASLGLQILGPHLGRLLGCQVFFPKTTSSSAYLQRIANGIQIFRKIFLFLTFTTKLFLLPSRLWRILEPLPRLRRLLRPQHCLWRLLGSSAFLWGLLYPLAHPWRHPGLQIVYTTFLASTSSAKIPKALISSVKTSWVSSYSVKIL